MKELLVILCLALTCGCARRTSEPVAFPFDFSTDADGCAAVYVRKLSTNQLESIHVQVNMMESGYSLRPLLADSGAPLQFTLSPTQDIVSCWIDQLPTKPDGFRWGHFMPPTNVVDRWTAIAGSVTLTVSRHPERDSRPGFLASVHLSNVVFRSSNTIHHTTLRSLDFNNVHVGWWSK